MTASHTSTVRVVVEVPIESYAVLAAAAGAHGYPTIAAMMLNQATALAESPLGAVAIGHLDGLTDAELAERLGCAPGYVATLRRSLHLPAHRRYTKAPDGPRRKGTP